MTNYEEPKTPVYQVIEEENYIEEILIEPENVFNIIKKAVEEQTEDIHVYELINWDKEDGIYLNRELLFTINK